MKPHDRAEFTADQEAAPASEERRDFLRLSGAMLALAASGCTRAPRREIVPYAAQPPEVTPGVASHYTTTLVRDGYGVGVVVESHEGRPTKIEGNPSHPASLGGAGIFEQSALLSVYDRDRGRNVTDRGAVSSWAALTAEIRKQNRDAKGAGIHVLLEPTSSTLTAHLLGRLREKLPRLTVRFHSALSSRRAWDGARLAFGAYLEPRIDFRKADVVLAVDSEFLTSGPASLRYARHFAERRKIADASEAMNRLYVMEPAPTVTGFSADHRMRMKRSKILAWMRDLFGELAAIAGDAPNAVISRLATRSRDPAVQAIAKDLWSHRGRAVVVVGEAQPASAHAMAHAMNAWLDPNGEVVTYGPSPIFEAGTASHEIDGLAAALDANDVSALFVLGGNPAYASARDLNLADKIKTCDFSMYLGGHENETARACRYFVPQSHTLESWGEACAFDGTRSWIQPLLGNPENARTVDEFLAALLDDFASVPTGLDLARQHARSTGLETDRAWHDSLRHGIIGGSASPTTSPALDWTAMAHAVDGIVPSADGGVELVLREDPRVRDGADTNNPWLLELPDPVTKLTWENAALVSIATASRLGVRTGDVVSLTTPAAKLEAPVLVTPGHADDSVSLTFGYGRASAESIADGVGVDAFVLQTSASPWGAASVNVAKTGRTAPLAITQSHFSLEGREDDIFLHATVAELRANPHFAESRNAEKRSLYVLRSQSARQWGMVVDLSACTGCSACVVACQAENNIAVVGKAGVLKGREMHWIRIDRYSVGDGDDASSLSEPMLCQHCERAPCEYVCPTNATTHSTDGLNQMVYNRCVGTRFCSNNCPWKVRRFNWFDYDRGPDAADPRAYNPDVTVRARGVMEKCTYCVQRIREAETRSKLEDRAVADHDVKTACEQACPSAAIVFGDIGDAKSDVSLARKNARLFAVLNDLGTVPHTRYLAKIKNPNEEMP